MLQSAWETDLFDSVINDPEILKHYAKTIKIVEVDRSGLGDMYDSFSVRDDRMYLWNSSEPEKKNYDNFLVKQIMYKRTETTKEIEMDNGAFLHPVATLKDESGGICQIISDDHCYIVCLNQAGGKYKPTFHLFREVLEVLKELPE